MSDHKHGEMDITTHEATFAGFLGWTKIVTIVAICVLIFLAIFNS